MTWDGIERRSGVDRRHKNGKTHDDRRTGEERRKRQACFKCGKSFEPPASGGIICKPCKMSSLRMGAKPKGHAF